MSRNEMVALIEAMNTYDEMAANAKEKADAIRETIKAENATEALRCGDVVKASGDMLEAFIENNR